MGTTTGLSVYILDVHHSDNIAWYDTSLVKVKSKLFFCLTFILEVFFYWMTLQNDLVSLVFYLHFDFLADRRIMGNINVGISFCFFGTVLPNMRTKNSTSWSIDYMGSSVEWTKCWSSFLIYVTSNWLTNNVLFNRPFQIMKETFSNFFNIYDIVAIFTNFHYSSIMNLASRSRIKGTSIEQNNVWSLCVILNIIKHSNNFTFEFV